MKAEHEPNLGDAPSESLGGQKQVDVLRVSARSRPASVAGAIDECLREHGRAEAQAMGAAGVNQAVKAIAVIRGFIAPQGMDLVTVPAFVKITINDEERTAMKFVVEANQRRQGKEPQNPQAPSEVDAGNGAR